MVSTDDAYLQADTAIIAPKISGYVGQVLVKDNQAVAKGQVLAVLDDRDYRAASQAADAAVAAAQAAIGNDHALTSLQQANIDVAQAKLASDNAELNFARTNAARYAKLTLSGAGTTQSAQQASTDLVRAQAQLTGDQAGLLAAQRQLAVLSSNLAASEAALKQATARARQAQLDVLHTVIRAPMAGTVGDKTVRSGEYVQPGTALMAVVPLRAVYAVANLKETQLTHIAPGQPVRVVVDAFPNLKVSGHVASISPASGQEFALLPPDNATGNFTKIVQRVPVKIILDATSATVGRLRPGMSIEPSIDTKPADQPDHEHAGEPADEPASGKPD